jgi:hypothetical protein
MHVWTSSGDRNGKQRGAAFPLAPRPLAGVGLRSTPSPGEGMSKGRFWVLSELEKAAKGAALGEERELDGVVCLFRRRLGRGRVQEASRQINPGRVHPAARPSLGAQSAMAGGRPLCREVRDPDSPCWVNKLQLGN